MNPAWSNPVGPNDHWRTPRWLFDLACRYFGPYTHDAAPGEFPLAEPMADGLDSTREPWDGKNVWINPPYSRGNMAAWCRHANTELRVTRERWKPCRFTMLMKLAPSAQWWLDNVRFADVLPLPRVQFVGAPTTATFECCLWVRGYDRYPRPDEFLAAAHEARRVRGR